MHGEGGLGCDFCDLDLQRGRAGFEERELARLVDGDELAGSGLVLPKRHVPAPFDLTDDELADVFDLARVARSRVGADGWNLGWNVGSVAGQEVEHVHLHVIPRRADEPLAGRGIRWLLRGGPGSDH